MTESPEGLRAALVDRYELEGELGRGGMASVYLALDLKHNRRVAIKVLRPELAAALGTERFLREIEIAAQLTHPHILPLFDSGEAGGFLYYVMPYVEGQSLRHRLERDTRLPLQDAVRITDQIASALAYAHQQGWVHRDIKPENILLAGNQAILADFGIARAVAAAGVERLTGTGLVIGTPAYMSPEQAFGGHPVDARTDVYALGCVTYEMLAGRPPFEGSPLQVLAKHGAGPAPRLRASDPAVPVPIERCIERALAKHPDDRFPTAGEFAAALTTGMPGATAARGGWRRWAVGAAASLLMLAAGWGLAGRLGAAPIERLAVLPLTNLTGDPAQEYLLEGVHEALISELAQLRIPVIARTTMRQYQGTDKPIREIARELGVDAVIEGSFFRHGDTLEIATRLYDGTTEREIWSASYDGDLPNAVALYRGFARSIAGEIRARLSPATEARLARAPPVNPAVYEAYLKGMYILNRSTPVDDLSEALGYFEQAIEANPADPLAYAGLADAYVTLGHGPEPPPDVWPKARAAAERALRLDSTRADVWATIAQVKYYYEWDWEGAERAFRRANDLNPSLPRNRYHYAWYLVTVGRGEEALVEHHRARELDPLTPVHTVWIPGIYWAMGDHERAVTEARKVVEQYPNHPIPLFVLGASSAQLGHYPDAIEAHERMASLNPRWIGALGVTYALAGRTEDALRILADLESLPPNSWRALSLAELHAALGNRQETLDWLEFEPPHAWWAGIGGNPLFDFLRAEPRFQELLRRLNLPTPARRDA